MSPEYHRPNQSEIYAPMVEQLLLGPQSLDVRGDISPFTEQIAERRAAIETVRTVFDMMADATTPLDLAVERGDVPAEKAVRLYEVLRATLAARDTERLLLYLPFELLPDMNRPGVDDQLETSRTRFAEQYLDSWFRLLGAHDVRANFVDGDVLEPDLRTGDLPRVVKAAHLAPVLIAKGYIDTQLAQRIAMESPDVVLRRSMREGLAAYRYEPAAHHISGAVEPPLTPNRRAWLEQVARERRIDAIAGTIARQLLKQERTGQTTLEATPTADPGTMLTAMTEGIYRAVEAASQADSETARSLYDRYSTSLAVSADNRDLYPDLAGRMATIQRRLFRLGLIPTKDFEQMGIPAPDLAAPYSENSAGLSVEIAQLRQITERIANDLALSQILYPVVALGGSRMKGYGDRTSDTDVSVFVRPETDYGDYDSIRAQIEAAFPRFDPTELWLKESDGGLVVQEFERPELHTADTYWNHLLFNTVLLGDADTVQLLQTQLLPMYYKADDPMRPVYLERLEQDTLQYRLMHKSYVKHYPLRKRADELYNDAIDGQSVYWDSGYRRLATQLYLQHVFLPKL